MSSVSVDPELVEAVWPEVARLIPVLNAGLTRSQLVEAGVELAERSAAEWGRFWSHADLFDRAGVARPGESPMARHGRRMRHLRLAERFAGRQDRTDLDLKAVVRCMPDRADVAVVLRAWKRRRAICRRRVATRSFLARHPRLAFLRPWLIWRRKGVAL